MFTQIISIFSLLVVSGCLFPASPKRDFSKTEKTIFSEVVRQYTNLTGYVDKPGAIQFIDGKTSNLDDKNFQSFMQANGAQCVKSAEEISCISKVVWHIQLEDRYAKCDHPLEDDRTCLVVDIVKATFPPTAPYKLKSINISIN